MARNTELVLIGSRSVQHLGSNSKGVTIPPEVLNDMGVSAGDAVEMVYDRSEKEVIVNEPSDDPLI